MPLTRILCPHCEQSVEVNMTSVTRSRECPLCGNTIMLQFTTQEKKQRRRALLTPTVAAGAGDEPHLEVVPQAIPGDMRDRMMLDPEVQQRVKVIKTSAWVIGAVLVVVVLGSVFHWWQGLANLVVGAPKPKEVVSEEGTPAKLVRPTLPPPVFPKPTVAPPTPAPPVVPQMRLPDSNELTSGPSAADSKPVPKEEAVTGTVGGAMDDEAQAAKVAWAFLKAPNLQERRNLILNILSVGPRLEEYYLTHDPGPVPFKEVESLGPDPVLREAYVFGVTLENGGRRRLVTRKSNKKGFLVDWGSFVLYSEMGWRDFISARPQKPLFFRVVATAAEASRGDFVDPDQAVCLKIMDPLSADSPPLYAYALRTTSPGKALEFVLRKAAGSPVPVMIKIRFPAESASGDQVWIDEFVGEGWVSQGS